MLSVKFLNSDSFLGGGNNIKVTGEEIQVENKKGKGKFRIKSLKMANALIMLRIHY